MFTVLGSIVLERHSMKVGLIGLPHSGKTTLFNALTRGDSSPAGGGSAALVSVVPVPDPRYDFAINLFHPKKRTQATIEFTDGAAQLSGEGGKTAAEVRRRLLCRHPLRRRPRAGRPPL